MRHRLFLMRGVLAARLLGPATLASIALLLPLNMQAQVDTGSLTGTVHDRSGASVPGSTVTLTNNASGVASATTSTSTGTYTFEGVNAGTYTLKVMQQSFKSYESPGVEIHVQQRATIDVALEPGSASEQVTVTAAAPLLQAEDASFDPATTRNVASGAVDAITGLSNASANAISVRDPFYTGASLAGITNFLPLTANLNQLPAGRLDPNAVKLLGLYPAPNGSGFTNNYFQNAKSNQSVNQYDIRIDQNFSSRNILFGVFSRSHRVLTQPGNLPGLADGQVFGTGNNDSPHYAVVAGYTHAFNASTTNEFHFGYNQSTDNVVPLEGNTPGIPAEFGISGVPQVANNGGLPPIDIGGLANLGVATYIPTVRTVKSLEVSDNVTKNVGSQNLSAGYQLDIITGDITQPPFAKGFYTYTGQCTTVPNTIALTSGVNLAPTSGVTGMADLLLTPAASTLGGPNNVGGLSAFSASNFATTKDRRYYMGAYVQDDWKATPSLTVNLGIRWDLTTPYAETSGRRANFQAANGNGPTGIYYLPSRTFNNPRSTIREAKMK